MEGRQNRSGVEGRLRALRVIWGAMLASVGLYAALGFYFLPRSEPRDIEATEVNVLLGPLLVLSLVLVFVSFVVKKSMLAQAAGRRPDSAQTALVLGLVLSEAAALLGLAGVIITGNPLAFGAVAVGAFGVALHFPRRGQLLAASEEPAGRMGGRFGQG